MKNYLRRNTEKLLRRNLFSPKTTPRRKIPSDNAILDENPPSPGNFLWTIQPKQILLRMLSSEKD